MICRFFRRLKRKFSRKQNSANTSKPLSYNESYYKFGAYTNGPDRPRPRNYTPTPSYTPPRQETVVVRDNSSSDLMTGMVLGHMMSSHRDPVTATVSPSQTTTGGRVESTPFNTGGSLETPTFRTGGTDMSRDWEPVSKPEPSYSKPDYSSSYEEKTSYSSSYSSSDSSSSSSSSSDSSSSSSSSE